MDTNTSLEVIDMFLCSVEKLNRDSRTSSLIKEFILITINKKKLRISQKIGFHIIIHLSVYECHLTLIGPVASMSEIANVTVACQWTKRSYILITSLTETPYSLWPQKRSYAYKKIETLTWVQIPFRYWNSMINDKHLAYWSVVSWDARVLFAVGISDCERDLQTLSLCPSHASTSGDWPRPD